MSSQVEQTTVQEIGFVHVACWKVVVLLAGPSREQAVVQPHQVASANAHVL
jgi:hypothetical protein